MRMKHDPILRTRRRATNVTLPEDLIVDARALNVNISKACQVGLAAAVKDEADRRWKQDNAAWIEAHRRWVDKNPLPLERYRLF